VFRHLAAIARPPPVRRASTRRATLHFCGRCHGLRASIDSRCRFTAWHELHSDWWFDLS
jgi:hypothetical protein